MSSTRLEAGVAQQRHQRGSQLAGHGSGDVYGQS